MDTPLTLRAMCLKHVENAILNLDNALFALGFASMHNVPMLEVRALEFVKSSFAVLVQRHSADELITALGADTYAALHWEQQEIDASLAKLKQLGTVTTKRGAPPPWDVRGPATASVACSCKAQGATSKTTPPRAEETPRRRSFGGGGDKCHACGKTVYQAEKLATHGLSWHMNCFRCATCDKKLAVHNMELDEHHVPFCKIHFAQRWKARASGSARYMGASPPPAAADPDALPDISPQPTQGATAHAQLSGTNDSDTTTGLRRIGVSPAAPLATSVSSWVASQEKRCARCAKAVYAFEMRIARSHNGEQLYFHPACFRCADTVLRMENWELEGGVTLLCKTHFLARQAGAGAGGGGAR